MKCYLKSPITLSIFTIALVSCTTTSENLKRSYAPSYASPSIVDYPAVGETKTAEVGESLISKNKLLLSAAVDLEQPIEHGIENLGKKAKLTLLPGRYVLRGTDGSGKYYQAPDGKFLENGTAAKYRAGLYVPDADPTRIELYALTADMRPLTYVGPKIPLARSTHEARDELSFRRELVYTGISGTSVSILYREFKDDMARPAFTQDLKYDLREGKVVGYRGARFEVLSATNRGITYKTLKQLD